MKIIKPIILFLFFLNVFELVASTNDSLIEVNYIQAFQKINNILENKNSLSFEDAIFEIENAYNDNTLSKTAFKNELDFHTYRILQLAQANKTRIPKPSQFENSVLPLSPLGRAGEGSLLNWAIYTYLTDTTWFKQKDGSYIAQYPMVYENNDPFGNTNWETTQITSLLKTNKGNCFSLAALYYIFSQRLQSEAYLTTAPEHIYIQHKGFDGNYYNVELTTHTFPGSGTIKTCTYTTHNAVTNGIALRRLNEKEAVALCLIYLAKGYEKKLRMENEEVKMDSFLLNCAELTLQHDSLSLNAMLLKAQVLEKMVLKNEQVESKINQDLENILFTLNDLGYEQMPATMQANLMAEIQEPSDLSFNAPGEKAYPFSSINKSQFYYTLSKNKFSEIINKQSSLLANNQGILPLPLGEGWGEGLFALSIDPLAEKFPSLSPYNAMGNDPINMIDPDGKEALTIKINAYSQVGMAQLISGFIPHNGINVWDFSSLGELASKLSYLKDKIKVSELNIYCHGSGGRIGITDNSILSAHFIAPGSWHTYTDDGSGEVTERGPDKNNTQAGLASIITSNPNEILYSYTNTTIGANGEISYSGLQYRLSAEMQEQLASLRELFPDEGGVLYIHTCEMAKTEEGRVLMQILAQELNVTVVGGENNQLASYSMGTNFNGSIWTAKPGTVDANGNKSDPTLSRTESTTPYVDEVVREREEHFH